MMWWLLFALTALVILLPMVPALIEWWRPTDVVPLFIDKDDTLDPPFLARSFASRLATAQALGQAHLGRSRIVTFLPGTPWPLDDRERAAATSRRVWDVIGDAELPPGVAFLGEVASRGSMRAAPGGVYRGLWAGADLQLPPRCSVLRWAHGTRIDVDARCELPGRISADELITVAYGTKFALLHAPEVRFGPPPSATGPVTLAPGSRRPGLPDSVVFDLVSDRGRCEGPLEVADSSGWQGDLVCGATLRVGAGCQVQGSLKARGALWLGADCAISGSVVAEGAIRLEPGCVVRGSVVSETVIVLGEGCVIGSPEHPVTVAAPRLDIRSGAVVHGTVWASERGRCLGHHYVQSSAESAVVSVPNARAKQEATA